MPEMTMFNAIAASIRPRSAASGGSAGRGERVGGPGGKKGGQQRESARDRAAISGKFRTHEPRSLWPGRPKVVSSTPARASSTVSSEVRSFETGNPEERACLNS